MKATVLIPFRDKHDHKVVYAPGDVKEFDNDRVAALAARGLVKPLEETPETTAGSKYAEAEVKPAKGKGKGKKAAKKGKDATEEMATETETVEASTESETESHTDADVEHSNDRE